MFEDYLAGWMFLALTIWLMFGFPVTFTLMGTALCFGLIGSGFDFFFLLPMRIWGVIQNVVLIAVPLFIFMGVTLERSGLAEELLDTMGRLFGRLRGGLAISVVVVGALLGASTGIVGATVVTMGLLAVPTMLRRNYQKELACGTVAASGTLGQIIPPSIVLVLLGTIVQVPVGDLFMAAIFPGLILVALYCIYILIVVNVKKDIAPPIPRGEFADMTTGQFAWRVIKALVPPLFLIVAVLGSIFAGVASPTEAAAVGSVGAVILAIANHRKFNLTDASGGDADHHQADLHGVHHPGGRGGLRPDLPGAGRRRPGAHLPDPHGPRVFPHHGVGHRHGGDLPGGLCAWTSSRSPSSTCRCWFPFSSRSSTSTPCGSACSWR